MKKGQKVSIDFRRPLERLVMVFVLEFSTSNCLRRCCTCLRPTKLPFPGHSGVLSPGAKFRGPIGEPYISDPYGSTFGIPAGPISIFSCVVAFSFNAAYIGNPKPTGFVLPPVFEVARFVAIESFVYFTRVLYRLHFLI